MEEDRRTQMMLNLHNNLENANLKHNEIVLHGSCCG